MSDGTKSVRLSFKRQEDSGVSVESKQMSPVFHLALTGRNWPRKSIKSYRMGAEGTEMQLKTAENCVV